MLPVFFNHKTVEDIKLPLLGKIPYFNFKQTEPLVNVLFDFHDIDRNGTISFEELSNFLEACGVAPKRFHELLKLDSDHSYSFDRKEFAALLQHLNETELKKILSSSGIYEKLFQLMDENRDGVIQPWELWQKFHLVKVDPEQYLLSTEYRESISQGFTKHELFMILENLHMEDLLKMLQLEVKKKEKATSYSQLLAGLLKCIDIITLLGGIVILILVSGIDLRGIECSKSHDIYAFYLGVRMVGYFFEFCTYGCFTYFHDLNETKYVASIFPLSTWVVVMIVKHFTVIFADLEWLSDRGQCWSRVGKASKLFQVTYLVIFAHGTLLLFFFIILWLCLPLFSLFILGYAKGSKDTTQIMVPVEVNPAVKWFQRQITSDGSSTMFDSLLYFTGLDQIVQPNKKDLKKRIVHSEILRGITIRDSFGCLNNSASLKRAITTREEKAENLWKKRTLRLKYREEPEYLDDLAISDDSIEDVGTNKIEHNKEINFGAFCKRFGKAMMLETYKAIQQNSEGQPLSPTIVNRVADLGKKVMFKRVLQSALEDADLSSARGQDEFAEKLWANLRSMGLELDDSVE